MFPTPVGRQPVPGARPDHRERRLVGDSSESSFTEDPRAERARVDEGSSCGHQTGSETILPYVVSAEVSSMPDGGSSIHLPTLGDFALPPWSSVTVRSPQDGAVAESADGFSWAGTWITMPNSTILEQGAQEESSQAGIPAYLVSVPISSMSASNLDAPMTLDSPVPNHASFLPEALYQARDDECCCGGCGTAGVGFEAPPEVPDITTVVMRNVPVRYTPSTLMQEIIEYGFGGEFDFFYLPFDHKRNCNHGYCFINLSDFSVMERFAAAFDGRRSLRLATRWEIEVSPAVLQGFEENLRHYLGNEAFRNLDEEYQPVFFLDGQPLRPGTGVACPRVP